MNVDECEWMKCIHDCQTIFFSQMAFIHVEIQIIHVDLITMDVIYSISNQIHLVLLLIWKYNNKCQQILEN
jgi:hypothetical protein